MTNEALGKIIAKNFQISEMEKPGNPFIPSRFSYFTFLTVYIIPSFLFSAFYVCVLHKDLCFIVCLVKMVGLIKTKTHDLRNLENSYWDIVTL